MTAQMRYLLHFLPYVSFFGLCFCCAHFFVLRRDVLLPKSGDVESEIARLEPFLFGYAPTLCLARFC